MASTSVRNALPEIPHFHAITGHGPYPWRRAFYAELVRGAVSDALDVPTGLGKCTTVLLARLAGLADPALPKRIVYVIDRRAIVDQVAQTVRAWIAALAALPALARAYDARAALPAEHPAGLGLLRGGLCDDGAWRVDPARPTVVVATVDMVGSRLLFRGYGDGRSRRAMHAGLLAHDALVLLDEAHLAPAFAALLRDIAQLQSRREFRTMTLSATDRPRGTVPGLTGADLNTPAVRRRLRARKSLPLLEAATPAQRRGRGALAGVCARARGWERVRGEALGLSPEIVDSLEAAGSWHDRGKTRAVWQHAAGAPADGAPLAKFPSGRFGAHRLGGYRHAQWDRDDTSVSNETRAVRSVDRFARLQAQLGPWRLAWLEALVKGANAWVSSAAGV